MSTCTTSALYDGWACGGSGENWNKCPGWKGAYRTDRAQAEKDCNACEDCHGIFKHNNYNRWYYCSKSRGSSHRRGKWSNYKGIFKHCTNANSNHCHGVSSGAPCSEFGAGTSTPTLGMCKTEKLYSGWACGGSGENWNKCAGWSGPKMSNKAQAQALCNACDDCHGIFSHTSNGNWYYCSKSRGTSHRRGTWNNYEGIFKHCGSNENHCHGVSSGAPCKQ